MTKKLVEGNFFAPIGESEEFGSVVIMQHACAHENECRSSIMSKARDEGFFGTIDQRLKQLDWRISQFVYDEVPF